MDAPTKIKLDAPPTVEYKCYFCLKNKSGYYVGKSINNLQMHIIMRHRRSLAEHQMLISQYDHSLFTGNHENNVFIIRRLAKLTDKQMLKVLLRDTTTALEEEEQKIRDQPSTSSSNLYPLPPCSLPPPPMDYWDDDFSDEDDNIFVKLKNC